MSANTVVESPLGSRPTTSSDGKVGFRWSIAGHLGIMLLVIIKSLVFPGVSTPYTPTLRVDMVDLPDALKKDMHGMPKTASKEMQEALKKAESEAKKIKPQISKEVAAPDELVIQPKSASKQDTSSREKKLKNALARIKSLSKIAPVSEEEAPNLAVVKGNKVSKGTSLSGDAREAAEATYFDLIRDRLHENWALPVWLSRQNLSAQVTIFIDAAGRLKGIRFSKSSGNAQFDEAVKKSISDSEPFPRPPAGLSDLLANGIPAGFPL